jgi:hypothetical protein
VCSLDISDLIYSSHFIYTYIRTNYERRATVINQYHLSFKTWLNGNGTTLLIVNGRIGIVLLNTKANPCDYSVMVAYLLLKK